MPLPCCLFVAFPFRRLTTGGSHRKNQVMTQIEETLAHLQRTVDDLSDVIARQETEIAMLTRRVQLLLEREAEREAENGAQVVMGKPGAVDGRARHHGRLCVLPQARAGSN